MTPSFFSISLDFELFWGVKDKRSLTNYGANIIGVREAIPAMLAIFKEFDLRVTWATVGLLTFQNKKELKRHLPDARPEYSNRRLDPYTRLDEVGADERSDPYHFGYSLVRRIQDTEGMEIGSHTFSHFYCLEPGGTPEAFQADLEAGRHAFSQIGIEPRTIVFPRNQYDKVSLQVAYGAGMRVFRGNPPHVFYSPEAQSEESKFKRLGRLLDSYVKVAGHLLADATITENGMVNFPASRFLRPYSARMSGLEWLRIDRICKSMEAAAKSGRGFHLWWHPHNFGKSLGQNLAVLTQIARHYAVLRERYGMRSLTMADICVAVEIPGQHAREAH